MNKQQKIIVSIVGITIVLLALLGLTYAYYLTRIEGNTNTNSISITTADLKIEYGDGNGIISATNIMPNTYIGGEEGKTFTVKNSGNTTIDNYGVRLELTYLEDSLPSIFETPNDFEITLTCTSSEGNDCSGYTGKYNNESLILTTNSIDPEEIHNYKLTIFYKDSGLDQSNDMGKSLNLKVQIFGVSESSDIEGLISGVDETYAMKLESDPRISSILKRTINGEIKYTYKFVGVEPGNHTLSVLDSNRNVVATKNIIIKNGETANVGDTTITVNEANRVISLSTKLESSSLNIETDTSSVNILNPFYNKEGTLAYHMLNNAIIVDKENNQNKAMFSLTPKTEFGKSTTFNYKESDFTQVRNVSTQKVDSYYSNYYFTYGTGYEYDDSTGKFNLTGVSTCKYSECYQDLKNKYFVSNSAYKNGKYSNTALTTTSLNTIYYVEKISLDSYRISSIWNTSSGSYTDYRNYYWVYGDGYDFDENTGKYSLTGVSYCKYSECKDSLVGKYLVDKGGSSRSTEEGAAKVTTSDKLNIYKVEETKNGYLILSEKSTKPNAIESTIIPIADDYGISYAYRGGVSDNFINFGGMCWRIMRIQGDGTIKLILADENNECGPSVPMNSDETYSGYSIENNTSSFINNQKLVVYSNSGSDLEKIRYVKSRVKTEIESWASNKNIDTSKLVIAEWCNDVAQSRYYEGEYYISVSFKANERVPNKPTLKCETVGINNTFAEIVETYYGILSIDEAIIAGSNNDSMPASNYLVSNAIPDLSVPYWTMTPSNILTDENWIQDMYGINKGKISSSANYTEEYPIRPSIVLKADLMVKQGDGTQSNPYILK